MDIFNSNSKISGNWMKESLLAGI